MPEPGECRALTPDIEGPYYRSGAPVRSDLHLYGDEGTEVELEGVVWDAQCEQPIEGARIEIWHADPNGSYDNDSDEMRYRGIVVADADGHYVIRTLEPGLYKNGAAFRPHHFHIKVIVDGEERLTTQLYFEGDPYIECDQFASSSRVVPFERVDGKLFGRVDIVLA